MKIIKGFVSLTQLINNTPGTTAILGELSTWSSTYSKEDGNYQDTSVPGFTLSTFSVSDNTTGELKTVDSAEVTNILKFAQTAIKYTQANIRPYDKLDFSNYLTAQMNPNVGDLVLGDLIDNGTIQLPSWASWTDTATGDFIKVWFADQNFQDEFDDYSITVIPPLEPLDNFFNSFAKVSADINAITLTSLTDKIQAAKLVHPETYVRTLSFKRLNIDNKSQYVMTYWPVLIYGKAGDNLDSQKDAIVEYVLANSTHSREDWEAIMPDLFKRTEFIIIPRWDLISIPNLSELSALYGNMLDPNECITTAQKFAPFYDAAFVAANLYIVPYDYKAINMLIVNGSSNSADKLNIAKIFPDYIPVPSTSTDFNRMTQYTQDWASLVERLLITAETAGEYSSVPSDFRKIKRNNELFISAVYDNVNYLVLTHTSMDAINTPAAS